MEPHCLDDREPFVGGTTTRDDDGRRRRSETRRDVDAGEGERAGGGRGNGENTVVGACEIDRSRGGGAARLGGERVLWMDFKFDGKNACTSARTRGWTRANVVNECSS